MKRLTTSLIAILAFLSLTMAQPGEKMTKEQMDRIHSYKIGYLTTELNLSPEESEVFWPIYNEYEQQRRQIMEQKRELHDSCEAELSSDEPNSDKADELLSKYSELEAQQYNFESQFIERMKSTIGSEKTLRLIAAEHQFRRDMMRKMRKGPDAHGHHERH